MLNLYFKANKIIYHFFIFVVFYFLSNTFLIEFTIFNLNLYSAGGIWIASSIYSQPRLSQICSASVTRPSPRTGMAAGPQVSTKVLHSAGSAAVSQYKKPTTLSKTEEMKSGFLNSSDKLAISPKKGKIIFFIVGSVNSQGVVYQPSGWGSHQGKRLPLLDHIICSTSYLVNFTCRIRRSLVSFGQEETDCYWKDVVGLIKRVHI